MTLYIIESSRHIHLRHISSTNHKSNANLHVCYFDSIFWEPISSIWIFFILFSHFERDFWLDFDWKFLYIFVGFEKTLLLEMSSGDYYNIPRTVVVDDGHMYRVIYEDEKILLTICTIKKFWLRRELINLVSLLFFLGNKYNCEYSLRPFWVTSYLHLLLSPFERKVHLF